jgi:hypothetical protein
VHFGSFGGMVAVTFVCVASFGLIHRSLNGRTPPPLSSGVWKFDSP